MDEVIFEFSDGEERRFKAKYGVKGIKNSTGRPIRAELPRKYRDTCLSKNVSMCLHPTKGKMIFV